MASRRNFTRNQKEQIVERAKRDGVVHCEKCDLALKPGSWEIDHIIAEGLRPEADKQRPITIAEGQLLGTDCCHRGEDGKTRQDVKAIAKGKRQYDRANGLKRSKQTIKSPGFAKSPKQPRIDKSALPPLPLSPLMRLARS
ncbi:HNH endonuclease [Mesorhizobium amorphae]|uniref:HNH endonuclease n=1 Tax=Mesorhizobium amorphae TaxID=71433 RepID=UPI001183057B|nr:HNH endonuclease [Mesorhizobium amorphae]